MSRIFSIAVLVFFLSLGVPAYASQVPPDGSADGSTPAGDASAQGAPQEVKPEPQTGTAPVAELATSTVATSTTSGSAEPRPTPTEPAKPASTALPVGGEIPHPVVAPASTSEPISPWVWLVGLLALAGGGVYGAYSVMKATQTKGGQSGNTCDAIEKTLTEKQYELSLVQHEFSFYEQTVRVLEEKAKEKAEAEKNKVVKKIENTAKDALLGKKGESEARTVFDTAEKAYGVYEDIQKKIEKTKEMLDMLRGKRDGLSAEVKTLEASYVACVAKLPETAKTLATGGIKLAIPGSRPIRAIIFDWAGVMATEAYWIWVRKNVTDVAPLMAVDQKVDSGEMSHEDFVALVAQVSGKTSAEVWAGVKSEMILNRELLALIHELKKKYKIGLLSNFTAPWLREVMDENALWSLFDEHIISSEHKLVKPDAKIYKKMLSMLDVEAGESVFADDRQINIDAAKKVGIRGFLFTDVEQFKKDLKSVGVSVKPETETDSKSP